MKVTLSSNTQDSRQLLLRFFNESQVSQFLAIPRLKEEEFDGNYFTFSNPVPYLGIQVKRGSYTEAETILVKPGDSFFAEVNLDELYDLAGFKGTVTYRASHPLNGTSFMTLLESDEIEIN